jgi:hypothetical protein
VLTAKLPNPPGVFELQPIPNLKIKNGGGMAFTNSGHFYIASRTKKFIAKFDVHERFAPMKFDCELPDNPEFLLHI